MSPLPEPSHFCPKCQAPVLPHQLQCGSCGIFFHKYEAYLRSKALADAGPNREIWFTAMAARLLTPPRNMRQFLVLYLLLWAALVLWGFSYVGMSIADLGRAPSFLHNVNLPFHEAGHVIFGLFGQFIGSLGGTLGQLIVPIVCAVALLRKNKDTFGASVCLWWFGQNFLDIAPYMADARTGELPLLGGNYGKTSPYGFHDWEFILGETGLLAYDTFLATVVLNLGRLIMLLAMAWGAWLLWQARQQEVA